MREDINNSVPVSFDPHFLPRTKFMAKSRKGDQPSIQIPLKKGHNGDEETPITPVTPRTPADEGIDFFEAGVIEGEAPIRVYELRLDPDGGPSKELSVCY